MSTVGLVVRCQAEMSRPTAQAISIPDSVGVKQKKHLKNGRGNLSKQYNIYYFIFYFKGSFRASLLNLIWISTYLISI